LHMNDATFYQTNDHGDVTAWGDVTYSYDAFGNEKTESTGSNPFRYSGEYYDEETGFIYLRNRYYDPSTGRFINEDPIKDGLNWYVYCGGNPVMFVDPTGETAAFIAGGAIIGGFVGALSQVSINILNGNKWHEGVIASAAGGAVYGAVFGATLNVAAASYAGSATTSVINAGVAIYNGESTQKAIQTAALDTAVNGTLSFVINKGVGTFIKTNDGWFQPQKLLSFFTKSYGQKIIQQTIAAGVINTTSVTFLESGKPIVKSIQQFLGIKEDGIYGPQTTQSVKEFQQGLIEEGYLGKSEADGIWGSKTDAAFRAYIKDNVSFVKVN